MAAADVAKKALALAPAAAVAIALGIHFEGVSNQSYPDPATRGAPYTICVGHTAGVQPHQTASNDLCARYLVQDVQIAQRAVDRLVKVPISAAERGAYTDFVLNAGQGNFASSTMLKLLNRGHRAEACDEFPRWVYGANGKVKLPGLVERRRVEKQLCLLGAGNASAEAVQAFLDALTD